MPESLLVETNTTDLARFLQWSVVEISKVVFISLAKLSKVELFRFVAKDVTSAGRSRLNVLCAAIVLNLDGAARLQGRLRGLQLLEQFEASVHRCTCHTCLLIIIKIIFYHPFAG